MWVEIEYSDKSIAVGVVYRPPGSNCRNFINYFENTLTEMYSKFDEVICMGDFNIDMSDIDSLIPTLLSNILEAY